MRGKLVVMLMFFSAVVLFIYSLWFVNTNSPIDQRFNLRRANLPDDAPGGLILRQRAGDFERTDFLVDSLDTPGAARHGSATYLDYEGKPIAFEAQLVKDGPPTLQGAFSDFAARAGGSDAAGTAITLHPEARFPYGYGVYSATGYLYYEISWINGNWILRASTREAGSESLLRFVNGYGY
jgi:hypothetical protein